MDQIKETGKEIEHYLITKRNLLAGAKISFIMLIIGGFVMEYFQTIGYKEKYKMSLYEWNMLQLIVFICLCVPFMVMPLYKFMSDKLMNRFVWKMKNAIFESVLSQFNSEFQISINGSLPEQDISALKLEKGWVSFVYGDDLIFGTLNNVRFRMSEMHSNGILFRHFDGIIAVLIFDHSIDPASAESKQDDLPEFIEMKVIENKVYLLARGNKQLFELSIRKNKTNADNLIDDQKYFKELIDMMNYLSLKL
jgi:hypothetical protein